MKLKTEEGWEELFLERMGRRPTGSELTQFKKYFSDPSIHFDEKGSLPEVQADDDHPFFPRTRSSFNHRDRKGRDPYLNNGEEI